MSSLTLVTGASSGIGRESAIALAEAGHDVIVGYGHHSDAASETAETIRGLISHGSGALPTHLAPGGRLAFDTRDPDARGWEAWTRERSQRTVGLPRGEVQHWYQTTQIDEESGLVDFCAHEITADGAERVEPSRIRFRSQDQIHAMLIDAGLAVENVFGGYNAEPVGQGVGALVITTRQGPSPR